MRDDMLAYARKLMRGDRARADDAVQDALIRAWRAWDRWRPCTVSADACVARLAQDFGQEVHELTNDDLDDFARWFNEERAAESARAWLFRIVCHVCMREHENTNRRREILSNYRLSIACSAEAEDGRETLNVGVSDEVADALACLSPERRTVLKLSVLEELPYSEIAKRTGVPDGTVMSRIHRAKRDMRASLEALEAVKASKRLQTDAACVDAVVVISAPGPLVRKRRTTHARLDDHATR
jgi:RNA polymerase sigma factor (sigma-70 family)